MSTVILSGACIVDGNRTLLLQQPPTSRHSNLWGPPGGHKEKDENLIEIAIREVKEETNLDIEIKGLVEAGVKVHKDGKISVVTLFYAIAKDVNQLRLDKKEVANYVWAGENDLNKNKYPLRDPLLKPILIKAVNNTFVPIGSFRIYFEK